MSEFQIQISHVAMLLSAEVSRMNRCRRRFPALLVIAAACQLLHLIADFLLVFSSDLKSRWNRCRVSLLADKVDESNSAAKRRTLRSICKTEPLLPRSAAKHWWNLEGKTLETSTG